ncbi:MAG: hypothetical protein IPH39_00345 [Sulfuritalea sp.]|jgi:hypothetical protein|nr:hypothetical protein [Sulfuritalea sp.]
MRAAKDSKFFLSLLALAYIYGLLLSVFGAAGLLLNGVAFPQWTWWQYLLAPLGAGLIALAAEALFQPIQKVLIDPDKKSDPIWKRAARASILIAILFGGLMALVIYGNK